MKRLHIALALAASIATAFSAACASPSASSNAAAASVSDAASNDTASPTASSTDSGTTAPAEKVSVVCSTFPAYDWVREIAAGQEDRIELSYLLESGVDLHNYQPSVADMAGIAASDLFVYVGGESDEWVDDALSGATNPDQRSLSLLAAVGDDAREEEIVEGMEAEEEEHDADGDAENGHDADSDAAEHEEGPEYDEHVWLSLDCARTLVGALADELSAIDPAGADAYAANAAAYIKKLDELDGRYRAMVEKAPLKVAVFADRFPFRYLFDDYGLSYYAAFVGCSAETEASFETLAFLAGKVDELGLPVVLAIDGSDQRLAKTVVETTTKKDQKILVMDSLQSTTATDAASGKTYLEAMEANLQTLAEALGSPSAA